MLTKRVLIIVGVVLLSVWSLYPPAKKIQLGLDLKGGLHLVLRVDTEDALRLETQTAVERVRTRLVEEGIAFTRADATGAKEFVVEGVRDDAGFRAAVTGTEEVFTPSAGDGTVTFRMRPDAETRLRRDTVQQARQTIERRVNALGVAEAVVASYTREDQILVQLPGVSDIDRAKHVIKSTAQLRLTLVEQGPFPTRGAALAAFGNALPSHLEVLPGRSDREDAAVYYVVANVPAVAGNDLRNAQASVDEFNRPAVAFTLTQQAAQRFGRFTEQHINRPLATVLDGRVMSVATIQSRIDAQGRIVGMSRDAMIEQVINLKSGALPADLDYVEEHAIGASLGEASVRSGIVASIGGLVLVIAFMLAYYKLSGLNALVSILLNLIILLGLMAYIPVTLTLPGIAGLILTIGMGVDSNVLIFERIKEELAAGRAARAAVKAGFDRVWITIVDTHVASLIAAAFLYQFGTTPIKGFATTLTIGLLANVFTSVFGSRTLFDLTLRRHATAAETLSI